jgi:lysozyme
MRISPTGLAIVKAFESCLAPVPGRPGFFKPYIDPVGELTIGWGHTNHHEPKFTSSSVWSQQQCDDALAGVMATFEDHVSRLAKVALTQYEFDALVSWSYNTGGPETATLWRKLNAGDKASVPSELAKWNRGGGRVLNGLTRRRKSEGELFAGNVAAALNTAGAKAPVKPPPPISAPPQPTPKEPPTWGGFFMSIASRLKRK